MTLQQLRYAVAIAEHKSMNKAAAELFITQPSLSNTIKDLENEIHTEIFSRSNRGIVISSIRVYPLNKAIIIRSISQKRCYAHMIIDKS